MKKWYKASGCKAILVVLEHLLIITVTLCATIIFSYPTSGSFMDLSIITEISYENTVGFQSHTIELAEGILREIHEKNSFETAGTYDSEKLLDIKVYEEEDIISGKNESGLAYRIKDVDKWSQWYNSEELISENIVVCQKTDGTYFYYYFEEFKKLIENKKLKFANEDYGKFLEDLESGLVIRSEEESEFYHINNEKDEVLYKGFWNFGESLSFKEIVTPVGAENLLEVVNNNPKWNGKLVDIFKQLSTILESFDRRLDEYQEEYTPWKEGETNLTYILMDKTNEVVYTNKETYKSFESAEKNIEVLASTGMYVIVKPKLSDFKSNMKDIPADLWRGRVNASNAVGKDYIFAVSVDTDYPVQDFYQTQSKTYAKYAPWMLSIAIIGLSALLAFMCILIWLTVIAGKSNKSDKIVLQPMDYIYTEVIIVIIFGLWALLFSGILSMVETVPIYHGFQGEGITYTNEAYLTYGQDYQYLMGNIIRCISGGLVTCIFFLTGYLSLIRRIKAKNLWKKSLTRAIAKGITTFIDHINYTWKIIALFGGFVFAQLLLLTRDGIIIFAVLVLDVIVLYQLMRNAVGQERITKGIARIAGGELEYKIPLNGLRGNYLDMATRVNNIGDGLQKAVEESMKSERLKTDLITNVSHDIKTPLTSIINYVGLLKLEKFTDPKVLGYLDILEAKAQRLKHLTEDVVEASKISSGNITLEYMNINLVEMINQTTGEFNEKFEKRKLNVVLNVPEEVALIRVDGRRMWRVLENIYNNAAKYALEGTRIYADLVVTPRTVEFSLKNVSEQALNISADELTERFIRGDVSRGTEGSGLGLSIAKNLTELQGGQFNLYLDGDLFKVTIVFPKII